MIVTREEFKTVVEKLARSGVYGLDTETTGLSETDRLFSIIVSDDDDGYYFSFNERPDHLGRQVPWEHRLPREWIMSMLPIFENHRSTFVLANAKFDLRMLLADDVSVLGDVVDVLVNESLLRNDLYEYSLDSVARRHGELKDGTVDMYIEAHGLTTKIAGQKDALKHFDLVPFEIMTKYGINDAVITRNIHRKQMSKLKAFDDAHPVIPSQLALVLNESKLTKVCFKMERAGIPIDRPYTSAALQHTLKEAARAKLEFQNMTGLEYEDTGSVIAEAFQQVGFQLPKTPKSGKPCTNKQVLESIDHPLGEKIREIRGQEKLASTYYSAFLRFADRDDVIHADIRQGGKVTMRMSYARPNLQNPPKEDNEEDRHKPYLVRRCFRPIGDEWLLVAIDYEQQEYRIMADYAGERRLIDAIMAGEDVHAATARMMGISRQDAKSINFGLLYGMGERELARSLKVPLREAQALKADYFAKLPNIRRFMSHVIKTGKTRGYIYNWNGFIQHCSSPDFAYKLVDHLCQGSGAQVCRVAMNLCDEYLVEHQLRTHLAIQVHDELVFMTHRSELEHIPALAGIMSNVYRPQNGMKLTCSVSYSEKSLAKWDLIKGCPVG